MNQLFTGNESTTFGFVFVLFTGTTFAGVRENWSMI